MPDPRVGIVREALESQHHEYWEIKRKVRTELRAKILAGKATDNPLDANQVRGPPAALTWRGRLWRACRGRGLPLGSSISVGRLTWRWRRNAWCPIFGAQFP
jgi:hypothetical protein